MEESKKKIFKDGLPIVICSILTILLVYTILLRMKAISMGESLGAEAGSLVGKAVGSLEGMTIGMERGTEAGKEQGLSAEDTETFFSSQIKQMENLEVLIASVKLKDFHSIGDNVSYAALYIAKGTIVFTVDMSKANITKEDTALYVELPQPVGQLYIDQQTVEKVGEYQRQYFNGSAEEGFEAYLNSMAKLQEVSAETIKNYDELNDSAKEAAKRQVKLLASSFALLTDEVIISFKEE